jgi:hypothetical protein
MDVKPKAPRVVIQDRHEDGDGEDPRPRGITIRSRTSIRPAPSIRAASIPTPQRGHDRLHEG